MYWKVAIEVIETIEENNRKGEPTIMVVPYGPLGPYARLVYLINKYRISLKNCTFINMDEYLTDDKMYIDIHDPLSFRGGMDRIFYSQIDEELNVLPENRYFPDPDHPEKPMELIQKFGKLDMVFGGVGINGHYAFNEPPEEGEDVSNEEFLNRPTRVLAVSRETRTINSFMNCGGDLNAIPKYCITVGMKEMFMAEKVRMCMPRDWNAGALRKVLHGEVSAKAPCSLFQKHQDAMLYAAAVALESPIPEIRVYNK
jgi:glucosamine-6-phosphate deaminase